MIIELLTQLKQKLGIKHLIDALGKVFPCLQPPLAFSATPSSGITPRNAPSCRPCGTGLICVVALRAWNLSIQLVPAPSGLPKVAVRPARSVPPDQVGGPVLAGCRRFAARLSWSPSDVGASPPERLFSLLPLVCRRRSPLGRGSCAGRGCPSQN